MQDQQHGNYKAYYRKRGFDTSERISCLDEKWFCGNKCIDIGCNEGAVTLQIAQTFHPDHIIGIDLDPRMIDAANAALKRAIYDASRAATTICPAVDSLSDTSQITASKRSNPFLPRSIALTKTVALTSSSSSCYPTTSNSIKTMGNASGKYPHNVSFVCKNVIDFVSATSKYDVVSCLSVTKWIHLTEGDSGLMTLFQIIYQLTSPGGRAIIEYQPWSSYLNNKKTSATTLRVFDTIQIRPEHFELLLTRDVGFIIEARLGTPLSEAKGFRRPILVLTKDSSRSHLNISSLFPAHNSTGNDAATMDVDTDVETMSEAQHVPHGSSHASRVAASQVLGRKRYFGELDDEEASEMLDEEDSISANNNPDRLSSAQIFKKSSY
jgi:7SK snRNA methylphosphate capping enzyme